MARKDILNTRVCRPLIAFCPPKYQNQLQVEAFYSLALLNRRGQGNQSPRAVCALVTGFDNPFLTIEVPLDAVFRDDTRPGISGSFHRERHAAGQGSGDVFGGRLGRQWEGEWPACGPQILPFVWPRVQSDNRLH